MLLLVSRVVLGFLREWRWMNHTESERYSVWDPDVCHHQSTIDLQQVADW